MLYNPAVGRFLSVDPRNMDFAYASPYNYAANSPIILTDVNGEGPGDVVKGFVAAITDYYFLGVTNFRNWSEVEPDVADDFNKGLQIADAFIIALAINEVHGGGGGMAAGMLTMQGGVATLVVPAVGEVTFALAEVAGALEFLAGAALATHGAIMLEMAQDNVKTQNGYREKVVIDGEKHPESARHAQEAIDNGVSNTGKIDRTGKDARRRENLRGKNTESGLDRDEFPPAVIKPDGKTSVKSIPSGDNRGAGSSIGHQLRKLPNGTEVEIIPINVPKQ